MKIVVVGSEEITGDLEEQGLDAGLVEDWGEEELVEAGIGDADALIVVGSDYSVEIPIALDLNPGLRTVLVADNAPDYIRGTVDVIISRELAGLEVLLDALGVD